MKKIKLTIVVTILLAFVAACSENEDYWRSGDWQTGEYVGTATLTATDKLFSEEPGTVIATGTGGFIFDENTGKDTFTLNPDTPLPSCHLETYGFIRKDEDDKEFPLQNTLKAYTGLTDTGMGCRAKIGGSEFYTEIQDGAFTRGQNGEIIFKITFSSGKSPYYTYEIHAHKKGWLW
jgi:hypothetical protein